MTCSFSGFSPTHLIFVVIFVCMSRYFAGNCPWSCFRGHYRSRTPHSGYHMLQKVNFIVVLSINSTSSGAVTPNLSSIKTPVFPPLVLLYKL